MSRVSAPKRPYFDARSGGVRIAVAPSAANAETQGFGDCASAAVGGTGDPGTTAITARATMAKRRRSMSTHLIVRAFRPRQPVVSLARR